MPLSSNRLSFRIPDRQDSGMRLQGESGIDGDLRVPHPFCREQNPPANPGFLLPHGEGVVCHFKRRGSSLSVIDRSKTTGIPPHPGIGETGK
ncbi:MAG: hypothetical protein WCH98_19155, partial [Verrucomicrobiota bacterium]